MLFEALKSKEVKHSHIVYLLPDDTAIVTSKHNHTHNAVKKEGQEGLEIQPSEKDNHTHELRELKPTQTEVKDLSDKEEVAYAYSLYKTAIDLDYKNNKRADLSRKAYCGETWDKADKARLKKQNRACFELNEIKPKLKLLSGYQRRNRTDIKLMPVEEGDVTTAEAYNYRIKNVCTTNKFDQKETDVADEAMREGRSAMNIRIALSRRMMPEIIIEKKNRENIFFGAHNEIDGSDAEYAGFFDFLSKAKLKELYPNKAEEIEKDFTFLNDRVVPDNKADYYIGEGLPLYPAVEDKTLVDLAKQEYKIIEVQRKIYKHIPVFFNRNHNFYFKAEGLDKSIVEEIKTIDSLNFIEDVSYDIYATVFAGDVLLKKEKSILPEISIVPFYCEKVGKDWYSITYDAIAPQKELNKRRSQMIDIVNKMASYGVGYSEAAFDNPAVDSKNFEENRNTPGFTQKFADGFQNHIFEFQGVRYPSEVVGASEMSSASISTVMNVYPEMMGAGSDLSGTALSIKTRQGLLGNEFLFDNFSLSKKRLATLIIHAIQIVDSPEKLLRIMENQNNNTFEDGAKDMLYPEVTLEEKLQMIIQANMVNQEEAKGIVTLLQSGQVLPPPIQEMFQIVETKIKEEYRNRLLKMLNNFELLNYDVSITESPTSPTLMYANYLTVSEMFRGNPNAPYAELIKMNPGIDSKTKKSLIATLQAQAQAAAQAELAKNATEIEKTKIAQEGKQNLKSSGTSE